MKISYFELAQNISSRNHNDYETQILLTDCHIKEQNWVKARHQITPLLEHKPMKEVCLLMAKIEEGYSGDSHKINAWISRSNLGKLSKIWVCHISGISQTNWASVSKAGYFNSLEWKYPINISSLEGSGFEINPIDYIEN